MFFAMITLKKGLFTMKKQAKLIWAALCAAGITLLSGCTNYSKMMHEQPGEYISLAQENTADAVVKGALADEYEIFKAAAENGTAAFEFEAEGIKFSGDYFINSKSIEAAANFNMAGSDDSSAGCTVYADKTAALLGINGNSGNHVYSITYNTIADKLATSVFAPESGSKYAMSQEEYNAITEQFKQVTAAIEGGESAAEENPYAKIITDYLETHPPVVTEKTDADINGETVKANILTYDIPGEDVKMLASQLADEVIAELMKEETFAEYYTAEDLKASVNEVMDRIETCNLKVEYFVNAKTHVMMKEDVSFIITVDGETAEAYIRTNYGADPAKTDKGQFAAGLIADGEEMSITADTTRGENVSDMVISMTQSGETTELAKLTFEESDDGAYTITASIKELEAEAKITGTVTSEKDTFTATVDRISLSEGSAEVSYLPKGVLTVTKGGKKPELTAEKEFFDITEEELDTLAENIEADFGAVLNSAANDSVVGGMINYVEESKIASANANAKACYVSVTTTLTQIAIKDKTVDGSYAEGEGAALTIGSETYDQSDYLGSDFNGYYYGTVDGESYMVNYMLWSEEPIPDEYKKPLTADEQEELANQGIIIGCYPIG